MIEDTLQEVGLSNETSYATGGSHNIPEIVALFEKTGITDGMEALLKHARSHGHMVRLPPEILHGVDVGAGAYDIVKHLMTDDEARTGLGIGELTEKHLSAAVASGTLHDFPLGFTAQDYASATSHEQIGYLIQDSDLSVLDGPRYIKGPIGEELAVAAILQKFEDPIFSTDVQDLVTSELLSAADLKTKKAYTGMLGVMAAYKLIDRIWYGEGNVLRGWNELDYLLSDRVALAVEDERNMGILEEGITWAINEFTPNAFLESSMHLNSGYLRKKIQSKDPQFFDKIGGTQFEEYLMENVAKRDRFARTINTPVYMRGVRNVPMILDNVERAFPGKFSQELDVLRGRFEIVTRVIDSYK